MGRHPGLYRGRVRLALPVAGDDGPLQPHPAPGLGHRPGLHPGIRREHGGGPGPAGRGGHDDPHYHPEALGAYQVACVTDMQEEGMPPAAKGMGPFGIPSGFAPRAVPQD